MNRRCEGRIFVLSVRSRCCIDRDWLVTFYRTYYRRLTPI
jgi:hypothetical protein